MLLHIILFGSRKIIIADPRTKTTLQCAGDGAEKAILLLDPHRQASIANLCELHDRNAALIRALDEYRRNPLPTTEPEVMQRIEQIAVGCG